MPSEVQVRTLVERWLEEVVIGLGLCPFAASAWRARSVYIAVSPARNRADLLAALHRELMRLDAEPPETAETTLLVAPNQLRDFAAFNDFLDLAEGLVEQFGWRGDYQIASFHPDYQFVGTSAEDPANLTNRSPYPILHLLREDSVERARCAGADTEGIPIRNIARMRALTDAQRFALFPFLFPRPGGE
jgi:hypothetical protein